MSLESLPPLPDELRIAVERAIVRSGAGFELARNPYCSPWRAVAAAEAVDSEPAAPPRYARSPRSTPGATRA